MIYGDDLEIKLQKVRFAMQEVVVDIYKTDQEKPRIISKLIKCKKQLFLSVVNFILYCRQSRNIANLINI